MKLSSRLDRLRVIEAEDDHILRHLLDVLPEIRIVGEARAVIEPGLCRRRDALLVELIQSARGVSHNVDISNDFPISQAGSRGESNRNE
jgi:hypothetical protein